VSWYCQLSIRGVWDRKGGVSIRGVWDRKGGVSIRGVWDRKGGVSIRGVWDRGEGGGQQVTYIYYISRRGTALPYR